jgi:flagellar hook-associated protein 1 FlgK
VLDNTSPTDPVPLEPPLRNVRYTSGAENQLFTDDPGQTQASSSGPAIGLPPDRTAFTRAVVAPANADPVDFTNTDFSPPADFSFELIVSNTLPAGANDGTFTVTVDAAAIIDQDALLADLNDDLAGTDIEAFIDGNGTLGFGLVTPGLGDIALSNYNGPANGNANLLLGFDVESTVGGNAVFGSSDGINGVPGRGEGVNGYPAETFSVITRDPDTGVSSSQTFTTRENDSAEQIATAGNFIEINTLQLTRSEPLQITLNGEALLEYVLIDTQDGFELSQTVPDPHTDPVPFNNYLAERINQNPNLERQGIFAVSDANTRTARPALQVFSSRGGDFDLRLEAAVGESLDVNDGVNPNLRIPGVGAGAESGILAGGYVDVTLDDGVALTANPSFSQLFGDTRAPDFAKSTFLGFQVAITGEPRQGDRFTIAPNTDGATDNRNALKLAALESETLLDEGQSSLITAYGRLVDGVSARTSQSRVELEASEVLLEQSVGLRNSLSAVNLDEEAANLIRFEQLYSANARAIQIARELFQTLMNAV